MGPQVKVSSERLEKPGIEPTTPGLQGEYLNHYTTEASRKGDCISPFLTASSIAKYFSKI